jgi:hypothetical protein
MELNTLLLILAVLICPICMGVMMWMMNKNMDERRRHTKSDDSVDSVHKNQKTV